jgi:hypothetical protein
MKYVLWRMTPTHTCVMLSSRSPGRPACFMQRCAMREIRIHSVGRYRNRWLCLCVFMFTLTLVGCSTSSVTTVATPTTPATVTTVGKTPVAVSPSTTTSTRPFPNAAQLDSYLTHLENNGVLSGSVLVAHGGMLFEKGYDLADKDAKIPNTPQTRFRIGSNTRQFTAMAILILQDLSDPGLYGVKAGDHSLDPLLPSSPVKAGCPSPVQALARRGAWLLLSY